MISVIMPTFNRERCIEKSVRTVLEQSVTDLELIVVDDGSSDSTRSIIEGIGDSRLHYIYQENAGACVARNRGIAAASGEYLAFQDSDDLWDKDKLKKQIAVLEANEQVDIVCCRTRLRQLDGSLLVTAKNHEEGFVDLTKGPVGFSTQTLVMRKTVTDQVKYDPNVTRYQDLDFLITAMSAGFTLYCLEESLVERTNGTDSITNHPGRVYDMAKYFEQKYRDIMSAEGNFLSRFFSSVLLESAYAQKSRNEAYRHIVQEAYALDPSMKTRVKDLMLRLGLFPLYKKLVSR